jgi:hypothetical protein
MKGCRGEPSLPLSLENKKLLDTAVAYEKELGKIADGKAGVIGYAYAVNGNVEGAEVFGSAALFRKLCRCSCAPMPSKPWRN